MFKYFAVLCLVTIVSDAYPTTDDTCFGLDISKEPRLEARQIDGWWFQQRISKEALSIVPANSIFFWQMQGTIDWGLDWDPKIQECTYRKFEESQKQSITVGPFLPCWNSRQILPTEEPAPIQYLYWVPTSNLFMYYSCLGELRGRKCLSQPFVGVLTRTRNISRQELNMVRRKLRSLGISMGSLAVVDSRENRCPLPMATFKGRSVKQSDRKNYRY